MSSKPAVTVPDPERLIVDHLVTICAGGVLPTGATIGIGVPSGWTPTSPLHVQVAWDGTPQLTWPIVVRATIRIVVRAATTTTAKRYANLIMGLLCVDVWPPSFTVFPLTGVMPATDPATAAELASFTVRVSVRTTPITP